MTPENMTYLEEEGIRQTDYFEAIEHCPEVLLITPFAVENYCTKCKKEFSSRVS